MLDLICLFEVFGLQMLCTLAQKLHQVAIIESENYVSYGRVFQ